MNDYIKTAPQFIIPKKSLSSFAGLMANCQTPRIKNHIIRRFIAAYGVNMQEALEESPEAYASFNDFFIRHLKPSCRPISDVDIVSPVDGVLSDYGRIEKGQILQAKGRDYSVAELLASPWASRFEGGEYATLYLSPKDYHRIHMPVKATIREMIYVPGALFSVQPATVRVIPKLFARNERLVVLCDTEFGAMAMVLVGAVVVGAIATSWGGEIKRQRTPKKYQYPEGIHLEKGDEMGYFKLGSTVVVLFEHGERLQWRPQIKVECPVQYGEGIANMN